MDASRGRAKAGMGCGLQMVAQDTAGTHFGGRYTFLLRLDAMLLRAEAFRAAGFLDASIDSQAAAMDYSLRLMQRKWRLLQAEDVRLRVRHSRHFLATRWT